MLEQTNHVVTQAVTRMAENIANFLPGFVVFLIIVLKGYSVEYVTERRMNFAWNIIQAFLNGLLISLLFFVKFREASAAA